MTIKPQFRQIATADVSAAELDRLSDRMNVPKIVQPAQRTAKTPRQHAAEQPRQSNAALARQQEPAQPRQPKQPKASPQQRLTIRIPATLNKIMKRHALEQETTVRAIILKALQKAGYEVSDADLAPGAGGNW